MRINHFFSPDDLDQLVHGTPVFANPVKSDAWDGIGIRAHQYGPWNGAVPPLRDFLIIGYRTPAILHRCLDDGWRKESVHPGDISLVSRAVYSEWKWLTPIETVLLHISERWFSKLAAEVYDRDATDLLLCDTIRVDDPEHVLLNAMNALTHEACSESLGGRLYVESVATQLCVHLLRHHARVSFNSPRIVGALSPLQAKQVTDYIEGNLNSSLSLQELAGVAKVSSYHFARQFKARFGCPPHAYVIQRRIENAKKLLDKSNLTLKQIAWQCGFCDHAHLTRLFKRHFNLTPKIARQLVTPRG